MSDEIIDISENEEQPLELVSRRDILTPAIKHVIAALGGIEETPSGPTYVLGDECYGCLKDLKRFWRKDDSDDERTVARIFYESALLQNDLVPIILQTAGKGDVENKCAIAAVDLVTGMTWPIDVAAELKELDEQEEESSVDYTTLIAAQLSYKRAVISKKEILASIFDLVIPGMAKARWDRTERDKQIVTLVLYLIRNLAFIRDLPLNTNLSADQAELSSLQSRYIGILHETLILDFLLTFASNALDDPLANERNTLVLEIFYLLFRSIPPSSILPSDPNSKNPERSTATSNALRNALDSEMRSSLLQKRHTTSRHSRFGTTIQVSSTQTGQSLVLHRGAAAVQAIGTGEVLDRGKKKLAKRMKMRDELTGGAASAGGGTAGSGGETRLSSQSREELGGIAKSFIESCFNPFLSSLIKDIRAERSKVTEKDNLRLLFVTKFFMQLFLAMRERDLGVGQWKKANPAVNGAGEGAKNPDPQNDGKTEEERMTLGFSLVLEVVQRGWAGWILRRMREATDMKPKQWTELQAGLDCLAQLLLLVDAMSSSEDEDLRDAAGTLQYQVYYNGEALERMLESMRSYKDQSFGFLEANIHLAYVLLRLLERWGQKNGGLYIRKTKKKKKRQGAGVPEEEGVIEEESEPEEVDVEILQEMTLEKFEHKFSNEEITATLMAYLSKFQEFDSPEKMKWVVTLMHRQAVRAKAEGLFFKVSILSQFRAVLAVQRTFPKEQPYKDLVALVTFLLRQFFKAVEADRMVIAEAFFPKNRGMWKAFSSWEPPEKSKKSKDGRNGGGIDDSDEEGASGLPPDIRVKKGHSWSEQLGIAIGCLCEKDERHLVEWCKELLRLIIGMRELTLAESNETPNGATESDGEEADSENRGENAKAPAAGGQVDDYVIPYTKDGQAEAATRNPHLKLLFSLLGFQIVDKSTADWEWVCPASKLPAELQRSLNLINGFLLDPLELNGKKALQMISKPTKRRKRREAPVGDGFLEEFPDDEDGERMRRERGSRRADKNSKEKEAVKSRQFIEDSDAEIGDDDAFFAAEATLRSRMVAAAANQSAGTKKRKKKADQDDGLNDGPRKRPRTSQESRTLTKSKVAVLDASSDEDGSKEEPEVDAAVSDEESAQASRSPPPPSSRAASSGMESDDDDDQVSTTNKAVHGRIVRPSSTKLFLSDSEEESTMPAAVRSAPKRLVLSDDEEEE
ncbi:Topoisomerase 1-associated factor 1 [Serendipita sp. 399]|nr:Topoisomerase 1-associated factor 1 [Serendipita sp. 399]